MKFTNWEKLCVLVLIALGAALACRAMKSQPSPPPLAVEKKEIKKERKVIYRKSSTHRPTSYRSVSPTPRVVPVKATPTPDNRVAIRDAKLRAAGFDPTRLHPITVGVANNSARKGHEGAVQ